MSDWITRTLIGARFMAPPEGAPAADGAAPASPPPAAAPSPAAAAAATNGGGEAITAGGQPAPADSTPAPESASVAESPSLLSAADAAAKATEPPPAPEAKPAEAKASDAKPPDAKPAEASPDPAKDASPTESKDHAESTDQAPAPLTLEDLTLPEWARADAPELQAFVDLLNNRELSDKDRAQGLWDLHHKDLERAYAEAADRQTKFWKQLQREWQEELRADREIGGNRLETSLGKVVGVIGHYLPGKDGELFLKHTDANGMGNYGPFIRMMVGIADDLRMYEDLRMGSGPVPPTSPPKQRNSGSRGWYDKSIDRVD